MVVCYQISWCATSSVNDGVGMVVAEVRVGNVDCEIVVKPNGEILYSTLCC